MWANYNYSNFPIVKVDFNNTINNDHEFSDFLVKWLLLYQNKKDFSFIFNTIDVGFVNPKYCFKMTKFIMKLKKFSHQYLQKSLIVVSNKYIKYLLNLIFRLQKPVAPVYIYSLKEKEKVNYDLLLKKIEDNELDDFNVIYP